MGEPLRQAVLDVLSRLDEQAAHYRKVQGQNEDKGLNNTADIFRVMANTQESCADSLRSALALSSTVPLQYLYRWTAGGMEAGKGDIQNEWVPACVITPGTFAVSATLPPHPERTRWVMRKADGVEWTTAGAYTEEELRSEFKGEPIARLIEPESYRIPVAVTDGRAKP